MLIVTHKDRKHIHTHFIVNSVNYEDGHKLQWSSTDLRDLKERCNTQSREQGLHVPEKGKTFEGAEREETVAWKKDTYQLLKQAEQGKVKSYVQEIALAVLDCKETATSREKFIEQMADRGYRVDWQDNHKYITFTDLAREQAGEKACKIRDNKLSKYYNMDFGKGELQREFEVNSRSKENTERAKEQLRQSAHRGTEMPDRGAAGANIGTFLNKLNADERASEEKRDHKIAERADREAVRERQRAEAERAVRERKARSHSKSRYRGPEL